MRDRNNVYILCILMRYKELSETEELLILHPVM